MEIVAVETAVDTADVIVEILAARSPRHLGVATGSSPEPTYRELVRRRVLQPETELYLVDEYVGLPDGSPASYRATIAQQLADPCGGLRIVGPDVHRDDLDAAAADYEQTLHDIGGVDLQLLGIGRNGHIGFNEPGTPFSSRTRVASLSDSTRIDNARFFTSLSDVPTRCITQGLATISSATEIILIATGQAKAAAVAALLTRPRDTTLPVGALLRHPRVVLVADAGARSLLHEEMRPIAVETAHRSPSDIHALSEQP